MFEITGYTIKLDESAISSLGGSGGVVTALTVLSQVGEATAKEHAPVDTGNLRRSITYEIDTKTDRNPFSRVGTNVRYGIYQELGTRHHPAQPFMRPAMEAVRRLMRGG